MTPADTEEVREISLQIDDAEFSCDIDQSFGVLLDINDDFGNRQHHRLYSVADVPDQQGDNFTMRFLVKRCTYVDDFSGEVHKGLASDYLCNRRVGDKIQITGPYDLPFEIPEDPNTNLILVGMGTGIAPFRAFIKYIYKHVKAWKGKVRLFYGARSGLELLYLNDQDGDLTNYYDEETFRAFSAISPRPHWSDPIQLDKALEDRASEILEMLNQSNTRIYIAGYSKVKDNLDKAFSNILGSEDKWNTKKAELKAGKKWAEVIY